MLKVKQSKTYNVGNKDAILVSDDAEAKTVTRSLDKVGSNRLINVVVIERLVTKDNKADDWRRLT